MDSSTLFHLLNASEDPVRAVVFLATIGAKYLVLLAPLHIALVWLAGTREMRFVAIVGGLAMAAALLASGLIGAVYPTSRPFMIGIGHTLIDHRPSAAFPSNHAIVPFAWAATLAIYGRLCLAGAFAAIGLAVAWSRIYLGLHFPVDMLGAALLATIAAAAVVRWTLFDGGRRVLALDGWTSRLSPVRAVRGG